MVAYHKTLGGFYKEKSDHQSKEINEDVVPMLYMDKTWVTGNDYIYNSSRTLYLGKLPYQSIKPKCNR